MGIFSGKPADVRIQTENPTLSLVDAISSLPAGQEADQETQDRFLDFLLRKQQSYSSYPTGWTPSIFQQFHEPALRSKNAEKALPEAKAYLGYFISRFSALLAPCLALTKKLGPHFTYGEVLHMLGDITTAAKAVELVNSLSGFESAPAAADAIIDGLLEMLAAVENTGFYTDLQARLCRVEIHRITQRYDHRRLPLLSTDIPSLQEALDAFSAAYGALISEEETAGVAQSVRIKILPILNELIAYAQTHFRDDFDHPKLWETIAAVADITVGIRRMAEEKRLETQRFQLDVNLELLSQLSKNMHPDMGN